MRGVWCQALSFSRPPVLGVGGQALLWVFSRRGWSGRGDSAPAPQRALLRAGVAHCGDGGRAFPGRVPRAIVKGVWGWAPVSPGVPVLGRVAGSLPTCFGCGCAGLWTRHCPFGVRALRGVARRGAAWKLPRGGGGSLTAVRGFWCQALSLSRPPVLGAGGRALLPVFSGRGWHGRGDPAPAPQRVLLQAGVAHCWGGQRVSRGGVLRAVVRGVWHQALTLARLPILGRSSQGLSPTCWGRGCAGVGVDVGVPPVLGAGDRLWVCVVGVVSVCLRGCMVVRCVPWCHGSWCSLPASAAPVPASHPLPGVAVMCVPWCRGWWRCTLSSVCPSPLCVPCLAGAVSSTSGVPFVSGFTRCSVFYPFIYPLLVSPPPWRAFFPASLVSLCVARLFLLPIFSFTWSFAPSVVCGYGFSLSLLRSFVDL